MNSNEIPKLFYWGKQEFFCIFFIFVQNLTHWWMKIWIWPSNVLLHPREPAMSWDASKAVWPVGQGRGFCSSPALCETPAGVLCPAVRTSVQGRHETENILGWQFLFPVEKLKELGLFSLEKIPGRLYCSLSLLIRDRQERWGQTFYQGLEIGQGLMVLN